MEGGLAARRGRAGREGDKVSRPMVWEFRGRLLAAAGSVWYVRPLAR